MHFGKIFLFVFFFFVHTPTRSHCTGSDGKKSTSFRRITDGQRLYWGVITPVFFGHTRPTPVADDNPRYEPGTFQQVDFVSMSVVFFTQQINFTDYNRLNPGFDCFRTVNNNFQTVSYNKQKPTHTAVVNKSCCVTVFGICYY